MSFIRSSIHSRIQFNEQRRERQHRTLKTLDELTVERSGLRKEITRLKTELETATASALSADTQIKTIEAEKDELTKELDKVRTNAQLSPRTVDGMDSIGEKGKKGQGEQLGEGSKREFDEVRNNIVSLCVAQKIQ